MRKTGRKVALLSGLALVVLVGILVWLNWGWVLFLQEFEWLGRNAQGYPEYQHRKTGIVFVHLPGGTFDMGSPEDEPGREDNEGPMHSVSLSPFMIAKYEVSQAEWERVMGSNPSEVKGEDLPVASVSWNDCQDFCRRTGSSLPTEAQWEYACRAGTTSPFAFGKTLTKKQANFHDVDFPLERIDVGSFKPSGFGLYDMHGNVWEWCEDVYDPEFYKKPEASGENPVCTSGSEDRVLRGGSWFDAVVDCRSACRIRRLPPGCGDLIGFRPVAPAP